ncbi:MAG: phage holin family protein [Blastocatellia bacterium]
MQPEARRMRNDAQESFTQLLVELAEKSATLVREEVALARQEVQESVREIRPPVIMLAIGIGGVALAALCLIAALILGLSLYWQPWVAALVVGLGLGLIASYVVFMGIQQFKQARLKPEQTIATLEENKEWLKEII